MTPRQFAWQLGLHGSDLSAWPEQEAARALLSRSSRARTTLADALANDPEQAPSAPHVLRVWRGRMGRLTPWRIGLRWTGLAVSVAAGLWIASIVATPAPDTFAIVQAGAVP